MASAGSPDTTLAEPHPKSNTQQTKNETVNVVVQQHSLKLLKIGILMPETCWVSKKYNKIISDIWSVFYSSANTTMSLKFRNDLFVRQLLNINVFNLDFWYVILYYC